MLACVDLRVSICVCGKFVKSVRWSRFCCRWNSHAGRDQPVDTRISESYSKKEPHKRSSSDGSCHRAVVLYHLTRASSNSFDANSASSRGSNIGWHDACLLDVSVERRWCAEVSRVFESEVQPRFSVPSASGVATRRKRRASSDVILLLPAGMKTPQRTTQRPIQDELIRGTLSTPGGG